MDEEQAVWCGLDLHLHDAFWPPLAPADFLAGDAACMTMRFGVDELASANKAADLVALDHDMDTTACFLADDHHLMQQAEQGPPMMQQHYHYSSSSLSSSKRTLSMDSAGSSSAFFPLDHDAAAFSSSAAPNGSFAAAAAGDDEAIMRAMMAVLSSASSPSSSESSSPPPFPRGDDGATAQQAAAADCLARPLPTSGNVQSHVKVSSTSLGLSVAPETLRQQQQQEEAAPGGNTTSQVYHMMSERKRREKLNDSFQTLRSLLPPCSKKDKTTVLTNAASYVKTLESQVSELEGKNAKLERHVPRGGGAAAARRRAKVEISRGRAPEESPEVVRVTVMVMVECDIVGLVLRVLERVRRMSGVAVLSVDVDTYSPQALLKAIATVKLHITDGDCWDEALFHEAMTKAAHDATASPPSSGSASVSGSGAAQTPVTPLVAAA